MLEINTHLKHILISVLAVFLAGCANFGLDNRPPEEIVADRAQAWADALLEDDHEAAYEYASPGYRQFASPDKFHARVAGTSRWASAEVSNVDCEEMVCKVRLVVEYPGYKGTVDVRRAREYRWVRTEGQWWLYLSPR